MRTVILADDTRIENCSDSSSVNSIIAVRGTYGEAGAIRDSFTEENSGVIRIEDEEGNPIASSGSLILLPDVTLRETAGGVIVEVRLRNKTEMELMQDQIAELQEAIIEE